MRDTNENEFVHFDVVSGDIADHFLGSNAEECFTDSKSGVYRNIMREWKILQQNLPESIYVRVCERHIDLMRAVIVGVAGTPYHDGLFFFDIAFPSDYPNKPPEVYYHSFGYRVNPNLYNNGRVCLSLLNTWHAKKKREKWVPSQSTILQVLLSIQALVLNENPYYNEPGNGTVGHRSSDIKSLFYNEDVFIITHKTSLQLLRKPPSYFEAFVRSHFSQRGSRILTACNEYANGRVRVGYYSSPLHPSSSSSSSATVQVSREFKEAMMQLYPRLRSAFRWNCGVLHGLAPDYLVVDIGNSENRLEPVDKSWSRYVPYFICIPLVILTILILFFVFHAVFKE